VFLDPPFDVGPPPDPASGKFDDRVGEVLVGIRNLDSSLTRNPQEPRQFCDSQEMVCHGGEDSFLLDIINSLP
jgi:hypothetical protein